MFMKVRGAGWATSERHTETPPQTSWVRAGVCGGSLIGSGGR
jgi:hypothetical protein